MNVILVFCTLRCYNYKYVKEENMKKKIIVLALIVLLMSGCGSKIPTLSNGDEAVVTLKNGSMISVNELYEAVKEINIENTKVKSLKPLHELTNLSKIYADL